MQSYELTCRRNDSNKKVILNVQVDPAILKQIDASLDGQYVSMKGEQVLLKAMTGDCILDVDDITLGQIGWLLANRKVAYAFLENKDQQIAIGILSG